MDSRVFALAFTVIIFIAMIVGLIVLQIHLSKKENKVLGLILPIICLAFSIIISMAMTSFSAVRVEKSEHVISMTDDGEVIEEIVQPSESKATGEVLWQVIPTFLLLNIPTAVYLLIYFACREKVKKNSVLDKMAIIDME